jgi:hypothetical protein
MVVTMDEQDPPRFYVMSKEVDEEDNPTGCVLVSHKGSVQNICSDTDLQFIYKCTLFCTMSMSILTPVGTR